MKVQLKIKRADGALLPALASPGSAGLDLAAYLPHGSLTIKAGERALVPTGLYMQIPLGYQGEVRPRSGLALKYGITVLNSPGTIDSDYRGEVSVILINLSNEDFTVNNGDRIAQLVITEAKEVEIVLSDNLDDSLRGSGGFGSSGV